MRVNSEILLALPESNISTFHNGRKKIPNYKNTLHCCGDNHPEMAYNILQIKLRTVWT